MIIIPARLASSRLANKILLPLGDVPLFVATARRVENVDEVVIAVDDEGVADIAKKHGLKAILTSKSHASGTDRIYEAARILGLGDDELVINVQVDEPFIEPENLLKFKAFCERESAFMYSCFKYVAKEQADVPSLVKVVINAQNRALYFSRSLLPYPRSEVLRYKAHLGIYAYKVESLAYFCALKPSALELAEGLEQLRALEAGKDIAMLELSSQSVGIDTADDYQKALKML